MDIRKRKGAIEISRDILLDTDSDILAMIFSRFFPLHIESNLFRGTITYFGFSPEFDEITEGTVTPTYMVNIIEEDGKHIVSFDK